MDCNFSTFEIITFGGNFQEFQIGWIPKVMTMTVCNFQTLDSTWAGVCTRVVFFLFNSYKKYKPSSSFRHFRMVCCKNLQQKKSLCVKSGRFERPSLSLKETTSPSKIRNEIRFFLTFQSLKNKALVPENQGSFSILFFSAVANNSIGFCVTQNNM